MRIEKLIQKGKEIHDNFYYSKRFKTLLGMAFVGYCYYDGRLDSLDCIYIFRNIYLGPPQLGSYPGGVAVMSNYALFAFSFSEPFIMDELAKLSKNDNLPNELNCEFFFI